MDKYLKKEGENQIEYGLRLVEILKTERPDDLEWDDIKQYLNFEGNKDSLRKANDTFLGGYAVHNFYQEKIKEILNNKTENNIEYLNDKIKQLENKTKELEKEKIKFQDQKREYKNYLRADARFEHLKETMKNEIHKSNQYKPFTNEFYGQLLGDKEAVLILSDLHIGLEVENRWNKFNLQIAKERLDKLKHKVIQNCKRHSVTTLRIELLGDLVNGYIHLGTRISNEEDVISQTMLCAEMLSNFINQLAKEIPYIYVYSATGNHGRCIPSIKDSLEIENFEKLIPWFMKERVQCKNVKFEQNKEDDNIIVYKIINETIFAVHGHQDKLSTIVDDLSKMLKIFPSEIHCGHYHRHSTIENNDIEVIVNGSFSGTDDYAKSIRRTNKPSQTLIIYNCEGQECLYNINLN